MKAKADLKSTEEAMGSYCNNFCVTKYINLSIYELKMPSNIIYEIINALFKIYKPKVIIQGTFSLF